LNLDRAFRYEFNPIITVTAFNRDSGRETNFEALIDTGADGTVLDLSIARDLELDLKEPIALGGLGGISFQGRFASIEMHLMGDPDLAVTLDVAFAPRIAMTVGNLLGLDVLEAFNFGLSQGQRTGFLGKAMP
jgi:hypothetical protein